MDDIINNDYRGDYVKIAIIDAELVYNNKHRFPNLASMKISGYYKSKGHDVKLKIDYENLDEYDKVFISKVFTETQVPEEVLKMDNVKYGGTGFFYDKAEPLPYDIEHHMPDYHLYDEWVEEKIASGKNRKEFEYYLDYSIGFTTRGCFRKCEFCVNKNYNYVSKHSPLEEFYDSSRKHICLLDDNILGYSKWKDVFTDLKETKRYFQYKQGMDERILNDEKCEMIFSSKYKGDVIFAFDNIEDKEVVEQKARLIRKYNKRKGQNIKFYVLCGFDRDGKYDDDFWIKDINDTFERIFILAKYNFKPYIMRYEKYKDSPYYGTYVNLARWCNQPSFFNNLSYEEFCRKSDLLVGGKEISSTWRYYKQLQDTNAECKKYFNVTPKSVVYDYSEW